MTSVPVIRPKVRPAFPRPWRGTVGLEMFESTCLGGNPLGDPTCRQVGIYRPPDGRTEGRPLVVVLAGFSAVGLGYARPDGFLRQELIGLLEAAGDSGAIPPMSLLFPDCLTSLGGSQYVNSPATGRYEEYVMDELLPWAQERLRPSATAVIGQSSGGFGALHLAMQRPGAFDAVGVSAGDMAFDLTFPPDFAKALRAIRTFGGPEELLRRVAETPSLAGAPTEPVSSAILLLAMGACYSPVGTDGGFELPFNLETAELRPEVWERWRRFDPVERLSNASDRAALARLRSLHLTASKNDEWYLDLGARRFAQKAAAVGVPVVHEEFEGGHFVTGPRFRSIFHRLGQVLGAGTST